MTREQAQYERALRELGCLACRRIYGPHEPGPVELHHLRTGGWGRGDFKTQMGLCHAHHQGVQGIHGMGTKAFDRYYLENHGFTQQDLLNDARALVGVTA